MHPYVFSVACRFPLPLRERVAKGRVRSSHPGTATCRAVAGGRLALPGRGAPCQQLPLTPAPSPSVGRGENGDPLNTYMHPSR